jgi:hypothetical protein
MDKLPSELISIVARDVVADMSFPICHLREVSRSFRDIFSPYQYLLVVIRGLWKIEILVKGMLACSSDTLRTEHLYVSDRASARTIRGEPPKKPSIFSRVAKGVRKLGAQPTDYEGESVARFQELLDPMCRFSQSTLVTLTLYFGETYHPRPHWTWRRHQFPQLKTLSVCYCSPGQGLIPSIPYDATPNIKEMRISVAPDFSRASHLLDCLQGSNPHGPIPLLILEGAPCAEMNELVQLFFRLPVPLDQQQRQWRMSTLRIHSLRLPLYYQNEEVRQAMVIQAETLRISMYYNVRVV